MKKQALGLAISLILLIVVAILASSFLSILDPRFGIWTSVFGATHKGERTLTLKGLRDEVVVVWDRWGVPHIFASNEYDLAFAFGYVQALDRLWEMDLERRLASGRLSELFGDKTFDTDVFYRTMGLKPGAERTWDEIKKGGFPVLKRCLELFAEGVNAAIKDMRASGTLPIEYKLLGVEPEPWEPLDTLLVDRLICWGLTGSFESLYLFKLLRGLQEAFGVDEGYKMVKELLPADRPLEVDEYIIPPGPVVASPAFSPRGAFSTPINALEIELGSQEGLEAVMEWWEGASSLCSPIRGAFASNNWVVSGALSESGKPMLCNDPHLALTVPPVWYEAHLVVRNQSGLLLNVRGVAFPGVPVIVIGRNDRIAWGFTNVGADVIDFYYYVWDGTGERYWYEPEGRWLEVERVEETILVKAGGKLVEKKILLNYTIHGPLVERHDVRFAIKWLGHYPTFEAEALRRYNWARGMADFVEAMRLFHLPAQNHAYADADGNIAWWACGRYPNRTNIDRSDPLRIWLPYNGSAAEGEWDEEDWIDPPDEVPHLINPAWGYIITANNRPASAEDYPLIYEIGWTWADYYRARRIRELIEALTPLSVEDMKIVQNDVLSIPARELVPYLIDAVDIRLAGQLSDVERDALDELRNWDYYMRTDEVAPTIFTTWLRIFVNATFFDEFKKAGMEDLKVPLSMLEYFVKAYPGTGARWFDDQTTPEVEDRDTVMAYAFRKAVKKLSKKLGSDVSSWKWGRLHKLEAEHAMGSVLPWLNYPELELNGYSDCVNNLGGVRASHGPSWRQIVDFGGESLCIIPGGQSGNPFSPHYHDQLELWAKGDYKPMSLPERPEDVAGAEGTLKLVPG